MGAFDQVWKSVTGVPDADLAERYVFVSYKSNGNVVLPTAGQKVLGVTYEANKAGEPAQVVASGFAFIVLGAALNPGQEVMSDASGHAIALDTSAATNRSAGVIAVGGAAGDIATVFLG